MRYAELVPKGSSSEGDAVWLPPFFSYYAEREPICVRLLRKLNVFDTISSDVKKSFLNINIKEVTMTTSSSCSGCCDRCSNPCSCSSNSIDDVFDLEAMLVGDDDVRPDPKSRPPDEIKSKDPPSNS